MLVCCFDDGAKETHTKSSVDAEVAAGGVIQADENLLSVGFPKQDQCIDVYGQE